MAIDVTSPRSRRRLLSAAVGAVGATLAAIVTRPLSVAAADSGPVSIGGDYQDIESTTSFRNTVNNHAILSADMEPFSDDPTTRGGVAISGISSATDGAGVAGHSPHADGVRGTSGNGSGVHGSSSGGFGVYAECVTNTGLYATSQQGVAAVADGATGGIFTRSDNGYGLWAHSNNGRGAILDGKLAQVHLTPASAGSHPHSGHTGDLFVDGNKRLWFCKGGTSWHQLA